MYCIDNKQFPCSTSLTMKYIGGKWKAVILIHLIKKKRYSELRKELPMVTERTLSLQLKELESEGILHKVIISEKPLHIEYNLSERGQSLVPIFQQLEGIVK